MTTRRPLLAAALGTAALLAAPALRAQAFPSRPLRLVVPNAAGGAADITARTVGQKMAEALGQPVVIDNRPSAGGIVAGEQVARAEPDGHTLLLVSSGTAVSAALFRQLPFDTVRDFAPVSMLATFDLVLAVAESSPLRSMADLLRTLREQPGRFNLATPQIGTTQHLAAELFRLTGALDLQIVPFNGTPPALQALRGGQVDAVIDIQGPLMPQISARALRPLALLGEQRSALLPGVPTLAESGGALAGYKVSSWNGLAVPARTPPEAVARLNREVQAALAQPEVRQRLGDLSLLPRGSTPAQLGEHLARDIQRWADVIARARIERQ